jgi:hypothetical protein
MAQLLTVKKPSQELQDLISKVSNAFGKLQDTVNLVLEKGREERFSDKEVGDMIREKMTSAGYSRMTMSRYLPSSTKHMEHASQGQRNKMLRKDNLTKPSPLSQTQADFQTTDIEQFSMADIHLYNPEYLGKVIDNLTKIYNEKTGQKVIVIFRKMIDDGSSSTTKKDKKYQPTPDEVKQREQKIMSLVEEGILRIADLVEQSGVSDSATRRYLQKTGYRIMAGTVSR